MAPGKSCSSSTLSLAASPPDGVSRGQVEHGYEVSGGAEGADLYNTTITLSYLGSPHRPRWSWPRPSRQTRNAGTTPPSLFQCGQTGRGWQEAGGPVQWVSLPFPPPPALQPHSPPPSPPQPGWCRRDTFCSTASCEPGQEATRTPGIKKLIEIYTWRDARRQKLCWQFPKHLPD